jgi:KaiC/GvpD/RAD55 family RecA-like ATPase
MPDDAEAGPRPVLLLTGLPGTGKTSVAIQVGSVLEALGRTYALVDLDWLAWFDTGPDQTASAVHDMLLRNLSSVLANYAALSLDCFVLTRAIRTQHELDSVRAVVGPSTTVVELVLPVDEIARRLGDDVTSARGDDLREVEEWLSDPHRPQPDHRVPNDQPIAAVAAQIVEQIGWW